MKTREYTERTGKLKTFHLEDEIENMVKTPKSKPSSRLIRTKKGKKAIAGLIDIEKNHNHSWYQEIRIRAAKNPNALALFYRGTKISFSEMLEKADVLAKSFVEKGVKKGDEIPACLSNTPETVYILLALNKIGAKINLMGNHFEPSYMDSILDTCSNKLFIATDDMYLTIRDHISNRNYENIIVTSLADSLPEHPELCDEYEPTLDKYYHYKNHVEKFKKLDDRVKTFGEFYSVGEKSNAEVIDNGTLGDEFLVTYSSGSTKVGFPKQIIHSNRSLITSGRFHDSELSGNPDLKGLRGMAHIHTESNTNVITCISDNLMQLWSVALEPEYSKETALDAIFMNKPNYLNMTTSHLIEAFKNYLIDGKFHENGVGRKMPWLFACFAVGEGTSKGEEKFINRGLRVARAGSGVKIKGFSLPYTTLCVGGGDCEHGGIYYTLWKPLFDKINYFKTKNHDCGLLPEAYVLVSAFKPNPDGTYTECDFGEYGIIAANSATTMVRYKDNQQKLIDTIMTDDQERDWISSNVYGYINEIGGVHVKGRIENEIVLSNGSRVPSYVFEDIIGMDTKNVLSCSVVKPNIVGACPVVNIEFQPDKRISDINVINSILKRLKGKLKHDFSNELLFRIIDNKQSFPLSGAGKRSIHLLEQMGIYNAYTIEELQSFVDEKKSKGNSLILKK